MGSLRDLNLGISYHRGQHNIAKDFYLPCLVNSNKYLRAVGFFTSTVFVLAWREMLTFISDGGKINIISSPRLMKEDVDALTEGYSARNDNQLTEQILREFETLLSKPYLSKPARLLAYLISHGTMEFKVAFPDGDVSISPEIERLFHDKIGIFSDIEGNVVVFKGSMNETYYGLSDDGNIESIDVFCSFKPSEHERIIEATTYFQNLWNNVQPGVLVKPFPDSALKTIKGNAPNTYQEFQDILEEVISECDRTKTLLPSQHSGKILQPHQSAVINDWHNKGRRGIIKHATGSGKTFSAICCIRESLKRGEVPLVLVPGSALLNQWEREIRKELQDIKLNILRCGDSHSNWRSDKLLVDFSSSRSPVEGRIIISNIQTARSDVFLKMLRQGEHIFLISDEVHRLGSKEHRRILEINSGPRLGLSATPERYRDTEGTRAIFDYFVGCLSPQFSLFDAINSKILTPYYYYPKHVFLTESEQEDWDRYSREISTLTARIKQTSDPQEIEGLKKRRDYISIVRSRVAKKAQSKISMASQIIEKHFSPGDVWIVYCEDSEQMNEVYDSILRKKILPGEVVLTKYHSSMAGDREGTLEFYRSHSGILVSIRCLDEGVDIPSASHALFLASSKNPREFIQRRGRILRKSPGKTKSIIYDVLALPAKRDAEEDRGISIIDPLLAGEVARGLAFSEWGKNPIDAKGRLNEMALLLGTDLEQIIEFIDGEEGGGADDRDASD